jgi:hypothetical protein
MDQPTRDDDDLVTWAERQAAASHYRARRPGLPNAAPRC